jgi:hypothetical protein
MDVTVNHLHSFFGHAKLFDAFPLVILEIELWRFDLDVLIGFECLNHVFEKSPSIHQDTLSCDFDLGFSLLAILKGRTLDPA